MAEHHVLTRQQPRLPLNGQLAALNGETLAPLEALAALAALNGATLAPLEALNGMGVGWSSVASSFNEVPAIDL